MLVIPLHMYKIWRFFYCRDCKNGKGVYTAFKLEEKFDLTDQLNYTKVGATADLLTLLIILF